MPQSVQALERFSRSASNPGRFEDDSVADVMSADITKGRLTNRVASNGSVG